ncbi:ABC transporter ATP-binding protein [Mesobacillus maritimus]|uniref:ABC transporter ATP-binding protein n=1 Tax=Mesobacillus maritimus TaxID=1643336 RepID=A0ABS7K995_9BACI|nr:ABC transporter ATP-binding protein [Mesobacillus maritimus]MBY0098785.1 ABC transporter ATP-binding protein [Mesobacillus maritimus]
MTELQLKDIYKKFGSKVVVNKLNLTVESGEMLCLLGPSGCGKSTTLSMIAGMQTPTSGSIMLEDKELTKVAPHKRDVGLVFQNYALFPHLSVFDNVAFGLRRHGVPKSEIGDRVRASLASVQLAEFEDRFPAQLSGGQQQRVALARTLVLKPKLVLFDEPLSNLDAKLRQALGIEIRLLQKEYKFTGVFVTHDQEEAMLLGDRIAVMNGGNIVQLGTPKEVYKKPVDPFVANFIGESNLLPIANTDLGTSSETMEITILGGHKIKVIANDNNSNPSKVMIRPESIEVLVDKDIDSEKYNYLTGNVAYINYTGTSYLIGIKVEGIEKEFLVRIQNMTEDLHFSDEEAITVKWKIKDTLIY